MVEKRPHPEGEGPNGDAKRAKALDAIALARAKAAEIAARFATQKPNTNGANANPPKSETTDSARGLAVEDGGHERRESGGQISSS